MSEVKMKYLLLLLIPVLLLAVFPVHADNAAALHLVYLPNVQRRLVTQTNYHRASLSGAEYAEFCLAGIPCQPVEDDVFNPEWTLVKNHPLSPPIWMYVKEYPWNAAILFVATSCLTDSEDDPLYCVEFREDGLRAWHSEAVPRYDVIYVAETDGSGETILPPPPIPEGYQVFRMEAER